MLTFAKPATTALEQREFLKSRGLIIANQQRKEILEIQKENKGA